jgi:hypothetical protein
MNSLLVIVNGFDSNKFDSIGYYGTPISVVAYKLDKSGDRPRRWLNKAKEINVQGIMLECERNLNIWTAFNEFDLERAVLIWSNYNSDFPKFHSLDCNGISLNSDKMKILIKQFYWGKILKTNNELKGGFNWNINRKKHTSRRFKDQ